MMRSDSTYPSKTKTLTFAEGKLFIGVTKCGGEEYYLDDNEGTLYFLLKPFNGKRIQIIVQEISWDSNIDLSPTLRKDEK